ncbi:hypothetical protein CO165_03825 [Candidatus Roizmanbacteria bacterium CG_4_9_14_3_um_filter_33_18]|uniref:Thioredoxin domain-containing protein n=1 Tax=Candidatus Roizmanbacteria bacterium CG_4_9_14_3_um_filter_33_18 TaxID=1974841 RepID=A0A2M7XXC9_9BACT|nr:MAG: hypothetical protein CO165_03825 [Candidatus Roizmanbacteria bacterium CG_4_9_14_3_um_filter_33_18]
MIGIKHCCTDENKVEETLSDDLTRRDKNKMNKYLLIIVVGLIFTGGVFFLKGQIESVSHDQNINEYDKTTIPVLYDLEQYKEYSEQNFRFSKAHGKTVLFFAATTWCSNCVALEKEIKERITEIPKDIIILKVDYDNDKTMKTKYAIIMQTSLILLDNNGKEINRWIGTNFNNLLDNIK